MNTLYCACLLNRISMNREEWVTQAPVLAHDFLVDFVEQHPWRSHDPTQRKWIMQARLELMRWRQVHYRTVRMAFPPINTFLPFLRLLLLKLLHTWSYISLTFIFKLHVSCRTVQSPVTTTSEASLCFTPCILPCDGTPTLTNKIAEKL